MTTYYIIKKQVHIIGNDTLYTLLFAEDQVNLSGDAEDACYILIKL